MPINFAEMESQFRAQIEEDCAPKRGEAIFEGTDYPRALDGFIGQTKAKEQIQVAIVSALARGVRLDHTLLESGIHGVGKTTLAHIIPFLLDAGLVLAPTGPMTSSQFQGLVSPMRDRDVLFIDEAHLLVQGGRNKADWLLPFLTGDRNGLPDVTLLLATTDPGVLPQTLLSRFMLAPTIETYSASEAALIVVNLTERMGVELLGQLDAQAIAVAADRNPRMMRKILTRVRDLSYSYPDTHPNLERAFVHAGVSPDGLTQVARDMLVALLLAKGTASIDTIKARLGEPGPLKHHEQQLLQRGLVEITGRGRSLTSAGAARVKAEIEARQG